MGYLFKVRPWKPPIPKPLTKEEKELQEIRALENLMRGPPPSSGNSVQDRLVGMMASYQKQLREEAKAANTRTPPKAPPQVQPTQVFIDPPLDADFDMDEEDDPQY